MKVSLAWIFDHINATYDTIDVAALVDNFNKTIAEIDDFYNVTVDCDSLALARVVSFTHTGVHLQCIEWNCSVKLPLRVDVYTEGQLFAIKREDRCYRWATSLDFGAVKQMMLPSLYCTPNELEGSWKKAIESDWIFNINNTSITHRPDMWGHRGVAREIAALLDLPLIPLDILLAKKDIREGKEASISDDVITITNQVPDRCRRFAGLSFEYIEQRPSMIWMVSRLSRVDNRAIDFIVDLTNYVMLDISQPLHAFDAHKIPTKEIVVRLARNKEQLALLDGQSVNLTSRDLIISDGPTPLALAGIMGGKDSSVIHDTTAIFLEAASFEASTIRTTSTQVGIRTEASARFEKSLNPNQNTTGILRFLKFVEDAGIQSKAAGEILSLGRLVLPKTVTVSHTFIEKRLGVSIAFEFICTTLEKLGFEVGLSDGIYTITTPLFREIKDSVCKEDIVEEIGRFYGYDNIPYVLPKRQMDPFSIQPVMRLRAIKEMMAFGLKMREVQQYAFFDEDFLNSIGWQPSHALAVQNPISANWRQLVTTLIPNIFKAVHDHSADYGQLRFFEWGRTWQKSNPVKEQKVLAGIICAQKKEISFYTGKALLLDLFASLKMKTLWTKADIISEPWFSPYETALISHNGKVVGRAGKVDNLFFEKISHGDAFIFELDGDYMSSYTEPTRQYATPSKYPLVERDISMLLPLNITVDQLVHSISAVDERIMNVMLIDFFQRPEWKNVKAVTMRFILSDATKTMTKQEVDVIWKDVVESIKRVGALVR